ncbi:MULTISPECIES: glycoside hydrolase family 108 protein [Delftia]|uniref:glycoside hydrolase family 108 protein n=1 Tax=Delftia TaxID=80865 RepID=UPI000F84863D|nr:MULTISPECIES: glycosyl hydrolase 108 family protein [Delftia]WEL99705.1 glycosyl hydrolase 108 family protein [Delftia tsuruhatensis]WQM82128.1 glycosyl hydrolase 108 family protein [Delftia tsuruhatensis]
MKFDEAFDRLLGHEGLYSNNSADPGGETMWGVTARVARVDGYLGEMRDLPRDRAKSIYRRLYWDAVRADELPEAVRFDVFDGAVNSGPAQSIKWLQRAAGAADDGILGPKTIAAAVAAGPALAARYNGHRLLFLADRPTWGSFGKGWARRIGKNLLGAAA